MSSPALAGASNGTRLASVVLTAKADARKDFETSIWAEELGRWLGVSQSTVAHTVLPELRAAGFLGSNVATNAIGWATGLECWVIPMYRAQMAGDRRHALALSRSELAVLLSLCEVLFGPGWAPKDKPVVPAGLLAGRTGRGAATDRLGLLLMVLTTGSAGWLQLRPGSVDSGRGRPAATVGGLLGCTAAAGAKVLARLQEYGVADVVRQETGSGLHARSRVRLVPVARAHGVAVREVRRVADAVFSDLAVSASGDLESDGAGGALVVTGVEGSRQGELAGSADLAATAQHHALHASVVTPGGSLALSRGFSGEGRGGSGDLPDRACEREDQVADGQDDAAALTPPVAEVGPLRGEKPQESPVDEHDEERVVRGKAGSWGTAVGGGKAQQRRRVELPADLGLRTALGPVAWLWGQLSGWQQDQVQAAAKTELVRLAGMLMQPEVAPQLLADRLTDRLKQTGGEAMVDRPYPWLVKRGLVQRPACSDRRCDDGIRLDTGSDCENCASVIHIRRAHRLCTVAEIDARMPGAGETERKRAIEERMRQLADLEAEDFMWRREQAAAERARRAAVRAEAEERAERERQAAAAAEAVRHVLPCEDCGLPDSAGRCEACGYEWRVQELLQEAEELSAASVDPADTQAAGRAVADVRDMLSALTGAARQRYLYALEPGALEADPHGVRALVAYTRRETLEQAVPQIRASVLATLARSPEAEAEARQAYKTEQNRRWFQYNPNGADAIATATEAANTARERTAEHLLTARLQQLRGQNTAPTGPARPASWTDRLPELAARPLHDDTTRTVTA